VDRVAVRALAAIRREVGHRAAAGEEDAGLAMDRVAAALEADPAGRALLDEAERRRWPLDAPETGERPAGARAGRERRAAAAHRALGELVLAGELVPDGPSRVGLPGFGRSTWRAIALLREGAAGPPARWAAALAAGPAADLGEAAPPFLRSLEPPAGLAPAAARLHALEAHRQDARDALLRASASMGAAIEAGNDRGARSLRRDCDELEARIARLDAAIAAAWDDGLRRAGVSPP
jgi:hypothetical protein